MAKRKQNMSYMWLYLKARLQHMSNKCWSLLEQEIPVVIAAEFIQLQMKTPIFKFSQNGHEDTEFTMLLFLFSHF